MIDLPMLPALDLSQMRLNADPQVLHDELYDVIKFAVMNKPRSLQKEIGISELGTPCTRKLVYKLGEVPEVSVSAIPWRAAVGTSVHTFLQDVFIEYNMRIGWTRFLCEMQVSPGSIAGVPIYGHSDVYDRLTGTVIDWKVPGPTQMKKIRASVNKHNDPGPTYRVQAHTYGKGFRLRGVHVVRVLIVFLPSAGELGDAVYWTEPFDESIADKALAKATAARQLGLASGFVNVAAMSQTEDDYCEYCPWFSPRVHDPLAGMCSGAESVQAKIEKASIPPPAFK